MPTVEATKTDDASDDNTLSSPPLRTGKLACSHWSSVNDTLHIVESRDLSLLVDGDQHSMQRAGCEAAQES